MLRRAVASVIAIVVAGVVLAPAVAWASDSPPYEDPNAQGTITLCDQNMQEIATGATRDRPTFWRAVGSQEAPAPFNGELGKASLYLFQPIQGVDPASWTGTVLTAASTYTNKDHPMAQSTVIDWPLQVALDAYPPRWNGWMQLRLLYSIPNGGVEESTYAAANLRITGSKWTIVDAGNVACDVGDATSPEIYLPYYSKSAKAVLKKQQRASASATPSPATSAQQSPSAPGGAGSPEAAADLAASDVTSSAGGSALPWVLLALGVIAVAVVGFVVLRGLQPGSEGRHR